MISIVYEFWSTVQSGIIHADPKPVVAELIDAWQSSVFPQTPLPYSPPNWISRGKRRITKACFSIANGAAHLISRCGANRLISQTFVCHCTVELLPFMQSLKRVLTRHLNFLHKHSMLSTWSYKLISVFVEKKTITLCYVLQTRAYQSYHHIQSGPKKVIPQF